MRKVLLHRPFRHMFMAQIIALLGTGLATVALGLLAYDIAGGNAALVLGAIFTIKMIAYVTVAPIAGAFADRLPRRGTLVTLDIIRALVALALPFVTQLWQIYSLIVVLQAASAAFTPMFQATIPDLLPDEDDYTNALSLSRLAYDLESLISPLLAAALLGVVSFHALFVGTAFGFAGSALLVGTVLLPAVVPGPSRPIYERTTRGIRLYLGTPRLRALLALSFAVSAAGAMVLVNTVVIVRGGLGLPQSSLAITMAAFGLGSVVVALVLPRILGRVGDRPVILTGAAIMGLSLITLALWTGVIGLGWGALLVCWVAVGAGYSAVLTPTGRLLRKSSNASDRPALFAAQFALSHACWLVCYPLAGALMTKFGLITSLLCLGVLTLVAMMVGWRLWPNPDVDIVTQDRPDKSAT
ncbi:MAG: MFS transporter [Sulfitobacter sp.]|nr:MFS transporter [Sulfitobacter sp.]